MNWVPTFVGMTVKVGMTFNAYFNNSTLEGESNGLMPFGGGVKKTSNQLKP